MGPVLEPRLHFRNLEIRTEASGQKPCTGNFWDVFIAYMRREVNVPLLSMLSSPPRPLPPFYPKYTSVYLCIRVNIMNFIEQQQMSVFFVYVSLYSMNVFVCLFVCFCLSISPVGQYLIFFHDWCSHVFLSLWMQFVQWKIFSKTAIFLYLF